MATPLHNLLTTCKEEIECAICLNRFQTPRALTCLHSFCEKCLKKHECERKSTGAIKCPLCQKESLIPTGNVSGFPLDFRVVRFIEALEKDEPPKEQAVRSYICDVCGRNENEKGKDAAFIHCLECAQIMCEACAVTHGRMGSSKDHTITNVADLSCGLESTKSPGKMSFKSTCDKHQGKRFDRFCTTCLEPLCRDCTTDGHQELEGHEHTLIKEYVPTMREEVDKRITELKQHAEDCSGIQNLAMGVRSGINVEREVYKKMVEEAVTSFCKRVTHLGKTMIKEKEELLKTKDEKLEQLLQRASKVQEAVRSVLEGQTFRDCLHPVGLAAMYREFIGDLNFALAETGRENFAEYFELLKGAVEGAITKVEKDQIEVWNSITELGKDVNLKSQVIPVPCTSGPFSLTFCRDGKLMVVVRDQTTWRIRQTTCGFPACYELATIFDMTEQVYSLAPLSGHRAVGKTSKGICFFNGDSGKKREVEAKDLNLTGVQCLTTDLHDHMYIAEPTVTHRDPRLGQLKTYTTKVHVFKPDCEALKSVVLQCSAQSLAVCPSSPDKMALIKEDVTATVMRGLMNPQETKQTSVAIFNMQSGAIMHYIQGLPTAGPGTPYAIACDKRLLYVFLSGSDTGIKRYTMKGEFVDELPTQRGSSFAVSLEGLVAIGTGPQRSGENGQVTFMSTK